MKRILSAAFLLAALPAPAFAQTGQVRSAYVVCLIRTGMTPPDISTLPDAWRVPCDAVKSKWIAAGNSAYDAALAADVNGQKIGRDKLMLGFVKSIANAQ